MTHQGERKKATMNNQIMLDSGTAGFVAVASDSIMHKIHVSIGLLIGDHIALN